VTDEDFVIFALEMCETDTLNYRSICLSFRLTSNSTLRVVIILHSWRDAGAGTRLVERFVHGCECHFVQFEDSFNIDKRLRI
jgi:hypothetical protein